MQLPAFLYGKYRDVKAACRRMVTQIKRGVAWADLPTATATALAGDGPVMLDTDDTPGLLVVDGPSNLTGGQDAFHLFAVAQVVHQAIFRQLPEEALTTLLAPAISTSWGFAGMLGQWAQMFLIRPGGQQAYLHALVRWWDELPHDEPRWSGGEQFGKTLWTEPTNIQFCLAREGLPDELFDQPVPPGGMAELVAQTRAGLPPTRDQMH